MARKKISSDALGRLGQAGNPTEAFLSSAPEPAPSPIPDPSILSVVPGGAPIALARAVLKNAAPSVADDPDLKLYTLTELEGILGLSHRSLLEYVKLGKIRAVKIGTKWRVSRRNLLAFIHGE